MWTLILTLVFMQQEAGTPVSARTTQIDGFTNESSCVSAADRLSRDYRHVATEPRTDGDDNQPVEDRFKLLVPVATCVQLR